MCDQSEPGLSARITVTVPQPIAEIRELNLGRHRAATAWATRGFSIGEHLDDTPLEDHDAGKNPAALQQARRIKGRPSESR